jgi:hypothetical protein
VPPYRNASPCAASNSAMSSAPLPPEPRPAVAAAGFRRTMDPSRSRRPRWKHSLLNSQRSGSTLRKPCAKQAWQSRLRLRPCCLPQVCNVQLAEYLSGRLRNRVHDCTLIMTWLQDRTASAAKSQAPGHYLRQD